MKIYKKTLVKIVFLILMILFISMREMTILIDEFGDVLEISGSMYDTSDPLKKQIFINIVKVSLDVLTCFIR